MSEQAQEIEILVKIGQKFYEGKLHVQKVGEPAKIPSNIKPPVFPENLSELVTVSDMITNWEIRPRAFLQPSTFAELSKIVREYNGSYVSAGKASHFTIPK